MGKRVSGFLFFRPGIDCTDSSGIVDFQSQKRTPIGDSMGSNHFLWRFVTHRSAIVDIFLRDRCYRIMGNKHLSLMGWP